MSGVLKITFFGLCYSRLMRKADPNRVGECSCDVCKSVGETSHLKKVGADETFNILKEPLDCNSNNVVYLFECKQFQYRFTYVGSTTTKFRYRINNYKLTHKKV